jgi:hypothetical protein
MCALKYPSGQAPLDLQEQGIDDLPPSPRSIAQELTGF